MDINYESMSDFHQTISTAFFGALNKFPESQYKRISTSIPSTSARNTYPFLGVLGDMREWLGSRIVDQLASHRYSIENREFEKTLQALRQEIEDDAGGAVAIYSQMAGMLGQVVAAQPDQMMFRDVVAMNMSPEPGSPFSPLCYDGQNFYDTDHPVEGAPGGVQSNDISGSGPAWYVLDLSKPLKPFIYQDRVAPRFTALTDLKDPNVFMNKTFLWGADRRNAGGYGLWQSAVRSKADFTYDNVKAACERMESFQNDEGRRLGMSASLVVVPTDLKWTARELFEFQWTSGGANVGMLQNKAYQMLPFMVNEYLPND